MPTNNERKMEICTDLTFLLHTYTREEQGIRRSKHSTAGNARSGYVRKVLWNAFTLGRGRKIFAGACRIDCRAF